MTMKPWHWLLAVAALVVPLQAVALDDGASGGGTLSASASLAGCGVSETGVSCQIDVSWSGIDGAQRYTATATLADGSVRDLGTVGVGSGGGATSIWVPYVGNGSYGVAITAWGNDDGDAKKLEESKVKIDAVAEEAPESPADADAGEEAKPDQGGGEATDTPPGETTTPPPTDPEPADPVPAEPAPVDPQPLPEPEPLPEEPAPIPGDEDGDGDVDADDAALSAAAADAG